MISHAISFHPPQFNPLSNSDSHSSSSSSSNSNPVVIRKRGSIVITHASKSPGFPLNSIFKKCETCGGQGAIDCAGCKGTGKNKKNGNIFERWKCYDCQGFGLKSCPSCGKGGLTPEQRGER